MRRARSRTRCPITQMMSALMSHRWISTPTVRQSLEVGPSYAMASPMPRRMLRLASKPQFGRLIQFAANLITGEVDTDRSMIPVTIVPAPSHSHFTSPVLSASRCRPVICSGTENADAGVGSRSIRDPAIPSRSLPDCVSIQPTSVTAAMLGPDGIPTAATLGVLARGIQPVYKSDLAPRLHLALSLEHRKRLR
jgi:hypothetical protein